MPLDGVLGDVEGAGDPGVAPAAGEQAEHLELPRGQAAAVGRGDARRPARAPSVGDEPRHQLDVGGQVLQEEGGTVAGRLDEQSGRERSGQGGRHLRRHLAVRLPMDHERGRPHRRQQLVDVGLRRLSEHRRHHGRAGGGPERLGEQAPRLARLPAEPRVRRRLPQRGPSPARRGRGAPQSGWGS